MKKLLSSALLALLALTAKAQVGTWHAYMSYYEPQQIVKGDGQLFIRASNSIYSYNLNDHSITTFDKVNALSDTYVTHIAWNDATHQLIVVYHNANIDLIDTKGYVTNISAIYSKSMTQDKTVNCIYMDNAYAYLGTGFGIVKLNMQRKEIAESYILNENICAIGIDNDYIYAKKNDGTVLSGPLSKNLIDIHNWQQTTVAEDVFAQHDTTWDDYIETVSTLQPGGPKYNNFAFMLLKNGLLYTCGGGYRPEGDMERPATVQIFDGEDWNFLQDNLEGVEGTEASDWKFIDMLAVDVDPFDSKHIFGGSRTGLYEFYDGKLVKYYSKVNSIIHAVTGSNKYNLVESVKYDDEGNLWLLQSQVSDNSIMLIPHDGELTSLYHEELMNSGRSLDALTALFIDSRALIWFVNDHWVSSSFYCYDPQSNKIVNSFNQLTNQDGTTYADYRPHCVAEDFDGNIWIGTASGPFLVDKDNIYTKGTYVTQVKVPRNDGSNYADYLLSGVNISTIAVDGGGRKWIGTYGSGVYLISADNMTQLQNFNTSNSPLLSNTIESIVINDKTGEVFFGTENGLCSYMSDATEAAIEMTKDNVYAYPNPVLSDYDGLITVTGLSLNADVKILSSSGMLVAQGRSNGGTFAWNGRDRNGKRVASGIYMVATATSDGKKGAVCKIAIVK